MRFGDDAQFSGRAWVEPYTGPPVTCELCEDTCVPRPERATYTLVLDAEDGQFASVCEKHLKGYREAP